MIGLRSIFLHSKIVIGDDKWVSVGSANWNDRSYFGDRDSEMNLIVKPKITI
jgi:phospholipase D1/2